MRTTIFTTTLCVLTITCQGQFFIDPNDTDFYQIRANFLIQYDSILQTDTSAKLLAKEFMRWQDYWGQRLYPHGNLNVAINALHDYIQQPSGSAKIASSVTANWTDLGPKTTPQGSGGKGTGLMENITLAKTQSGGVLMYASSPVGGVFKSTDLGNTWTNTSTDNLPQIGVGEIEVNPDNPDMVFIATGSKDVEWTFSIGVYRSTDGGNTWTSVSQGLLSTPLNFFITDLLINPDNPDEMFAATSKGLFKTTNATSSCTWSEITDIDVQGKYFRNIVYKEDGNYTTLYAAGKDIYTSANSGADWSSMTGTGTGLDFTQAPFVGKTVLKILLATTPANSDYVYAKIPVSSAQNYFYKFDGTNWILKTSIPVVLVFGSKLNALFVDAGNADIIYVGTTVIHRSIDGGTSWDANTGTPFTVDPITSYNGAVHADIHDLKLGPSGTSLENILFTACDGGIYRTTVDASTATTSTWQTLNNGLEVGTIYKLGVSPTNPNLILIGEQDCGNNIYDPDFFTTNPWRIFETGDGFESFFDYTNNDIFYTGNMQPYCYQQQAGLILKRWIRTGTTFTPTVITPTFLGFCPDFSPPYIIHPTNSNIIFTEEWGIAKGTWTGTNMSWQGIGGFPYTPPSGCTGGLGRVDQIAMVATNNNYMYVATLPGYNPTDPCNPLPMLFKSTDGGSTWTDISPTGIPACSTFFCIPQITGIAIHPDYPDIIWISFSGYYQDYKVWMYDVVLGGGMAWLPYNDGLPNMPCNTIVFQNGSGLDNRLYAGTDVGVYYRDASMSQWEPFMDGLPNVSVRELEINDCAGKIRAATFGRGLWESDLAVPSNFAQSLTISAATSWSNTSKSIFGNITLNADLTITDSRVNFAEGGYKITVNSGKTLIIDNSIISSCSGMWQGIEVKDGGTVKIINGSKIFDALVAVKIETNASYEITNSTFNRNERHILISDKTANTTFQTITGNQFLNTDPLKDQTKGLPIGSQRFGNTGITLTNCTMPVNIGSATTTQNHFESGWYSIYVSQSYANIDNNSFNNIYQYAIYALGQNAHHVVTITGNTFQNTVLDAIFLQYGIDATIDGNTIANSGRYGVRYQYNPGHYLIVGSPSLSGTNSFTGNNGAAIQTYSNSDKDNTKIIIYGNQIKDADGEGIVILESPLGSDRKYKNLEIKGNTITNLSDDAIKLTNIIGYGSHDFCVPQQIPPSLSHERSDIVFNTISVKASVKPQIRGIAGISSPGFRIAYNQITTDDSYNWQNSAIDFSNSPGSTIMHNTLQAGKGTEIRLDMTKSDIFCNEYNNNVVGIQLEWEWMRGANQTHGDGGARDNTFNNTATWGADMEVYYSSLDYNQWIFSTTDNPDGSPSSDPYIFLNNATGTKTTIVAGANNSLCGVICKSAGTGVNYVNQHIIHTDNVLQWIANYFYQVKKNQTGQGNSGTASIFQKKLIAVENFIAQQKYNSARGLLNTMNPTMSIEQYYKDVYNIHIDSRINGIRTLTSSEINTLASIAKQNPKAAGPAVYSARAILKAEENMDFFDDESGTATITGYAISLCTSDSLAGIKLAMIDTNGVEQNVAYAVTDSTGRFGFNSHPFGLEVLDTTQLFGFKVISPSGFAVVNPQYKTVRQWVNASPFVLSITDFIPPVAQFIVFTKAITGSPLSFTNSSTGNALTYFWNFGDSNTSTDENPVHTYTEPGQYTACLITTNGCGSDTFCSQIAVTGNFQKAYGGGSNDNGQNLTITREGDILLAGYSTSFGLSGDNIILLKTNAIGTVQWTKVYSGINSEEGNSVIQAGDGGYLLCGRTFSFGAGNSDVIVVKTDALGAIQWAKTYGGAGVDYGRAIRPTADGGYIFIGVTASGAIGGSDILIIKIDSAGNTLWQKAYGGANGELPYYIEPTTGGYIIVGYRHDYLPQREIFLLKIDYSGNVLWMKAYHDGQWNIGQGVDEIKFVNLNDRNATPRTVGYLVAGYTTSYGAGAEDIFAMQTDTAGNIQWVKTYGGAAMDVTRSVRQIGGGHYLIGGYTASFGNGNGDIYLLNIDSTGNLLFSRTYGGSGSDMQITLATDDIMQFTPDRSVALLSSTNSFGAGGSDMYLVKTNFDDTAECNVINNPATVVNTAILTATAVTPSLVNLSLSVTSPALTQTSPSITETLVCPAPSFSAKKGNSGNENDGEQKEESSVASNDNYNAPLQNHQPPHGEVPIGIGMNGTVSVFPNPSTGELNIVYSLAGNQKAEFAVYDMIGKKLQQYYLPADKNVYTISDLKLENGVYFYGVSVGQEYVTTGKIVVVK